MAGCNKINFKVIKNCSGELCDPLKYIWDKVFKN